ncbi:hypothetical protein [Ancylobacter rudongensis]|uniref:Uncharacterized protein n=1 Tax=Ancylobacter rudongensis TaxID=177413 RepID=A0A1G4UQA2_9HYPH|nr:hypothetical protein [Ancylobacter rudongensis]SCW95838.1 hypothetical protein SAMN05660859_0130 [Ancylobacter rudongensis]
MSGNPNWLEGLSHTPHPDTWSYDKAGGNIVCPSAKGGTRPLIDMRGWGYLTGHGHGALGLTLKEGRKEQDVLAEFLLQACRAAAAKPEVKP